MELELSTPALLFSAITLLMLAFTNRFLAIASLIRGLHKSYLDAQDKESIVKQIHNLRRRLRLIKNMQLFGVGSFLLCVICMYLLFHGFTGAANWVFVGSMGSLLVALVLSMIEIQLSTKALNLEMGDMEQIYKRGTSNIDFKLKKDIRKDEE
jgi:TRAP-type mannitol/chloroaromatic compound transport system permease large subunit